jgi:hypothetical protein
MKNYNFAQNFRELYAKATGLFARGQRGADTFFTAEEKAWLAANGLTAQYLYDYAEDQNDSNEPGYDHALTIEFVRRAYFIEQQGERASAVVLDETKLPAKTAAVRGIEWLPRIIPKAKAKLRGELPATLMFCCGGDRRFFKAHDILPAEFLSVVWNHENEDSAIVDWVAAHSAASGKAAAA